MILRDDVIISLGITPPQLVVDFEHNHRLHLLQGDMIKGVYKVGKSDNSRLLLLNFITKIATMRMQ